MSKHIIDLYKMAFNLNKKICQRDNLIIITNYGYGRNYKYTKYYSITRMGKIVYAGSETKKNYDF